MANLILASKREVKSGSQMWHVYRLSENTKSGVTLCVFAPQAQRCNPAQSHLHEVDG